MSPGLSFNHQPTARMSAASTLAGQSYSRDGTNRTPDVLVPGQAPYHWATSRWRRSESNRLRQRLQGAPAALAVIPPTGNREAVDAVPPLLVHYCMRCLASITTATPMHVGRMLPVDLGIVVQHRLLPVMLDAKYLALGKLGLAARLCPRPNPMTDLCRRVNVINLKFFCAATDHARLADKPFSPPSGKPEALILALPSRVRIGHGPTLPELSGLESQRHAHGAVAVAVIPVCVEVARIERAALSMPSRRSTPELHPHGRRRDRRQPAAGTETACLEMLTLWTCQKAKPAERLAGTAGFEPARCGFGDRCSAVELRPYKTEAACWTSLQAAPGG